MTYVPVAEFAVLVNHPAGPEAHFSTAEADRLAVQAREVAQPIVRELSDGALTILDVRAERGCLTLVFVLGAVATTPVEAITLAGIAGGLFAFITKYESFKKGVNEIRKDVAKALSAASKLKVTPFRTRAPETLPAKRPPAPAADLKEWLIRELSTDCPARVEAIRWLQSRNPPVTADPVVWTIDADTDDSDLKQLAAAVRKPTP